MRLNLGRLAAYLIIGGVVLFFPGLSSALSPEQRSLYDSGVYFTDIDSICLADTPTPEETEVSDPDPGSGSEKGGLYMLGDSITVGAKKDLEAGFKDKFSSVYVNGSEGRSITGKGTTNGFKTSGMEAVEDDKERIKSAKTIVVALGTNQNPNFEESIKDIVEEIKKINENASLHWVEAFSKGKVDAEKINSSINKMSSESYKVIEIKKDTVELGSDNLHPTSEGAKKFAELVVSGASGDSGNEQQQLTGGCKCGKSSSSSTSLSGSDNEGKIFNFFVKKGLSKEQAAGIVGNFAVESRFDPFIQEVGKTPPIGGFGIAQWTGTGRPGDPAGARRLNMIKAMKDKGIKVDLAKQTIPKEGNNADDVLAAQLDYTWDEATKRGDIAKMKTEKTVIGAVTSWLKNFEIAGIEHPEKREQAGKDAINRHGSGATSSAPSEPSEVATCTTEGEDGSGEVTGNYALPVQKKWYDQNKGWFTKPHHSYAASDIPVPTGTSIYSMTDGKVIQAPNGTVSGGFGLGVTIDAGNGVIYYYGHGTDGGSVKGAKQGDTVKAGQKIMTSGNTGSSTGPHLHLEIRTDGTRRCPQSLFTSIVDGKPKNEKSLPTSGCVRGGRPI